MDTLWGWATQWQKSLLHSRKYHSQGWQQCFAEGWWEGASHYQHVPRKLWLVCRKTHRTRVLRPHCTLQVKPICFWAWTVWTFFILGIFGDREWRWFCRTPVSCIHCHISEIDVPCISSGIYSCQLGSGGCCYQTFGFLAADWGGGLFVGFHLMGFLPSPSTISSSLKSLILVVNLPSHLKPAWGHKSGQDHPKISVSLHKSNSFTILQHNTLKYACLARSLPAALPDCLPEEWGPLGIV